MTSVDKVVWWITTTIRKNRVALLISIGNAVLLSVFSYFLNNQPLFTGEDLEQYAWLEWLKDKIKVGHVNDDIPSLYINVSYDKQLVKKTDEFGITVGNTDITDRGKLLALLRLLKTSDQYKYVFLDVRFEKGYETDVDSALFAEISNMRNTVVATHSDVEIADTIISHKAALSDYYATVIATGFARYQFLQDKKPTMPLYAYADLTGKTISKRGLLYVSDGKVCHNSLFIRFLIEPFREFGHNNEKMYYNLGSDILDGYGERDMAILTKGKCVVIGNMIEDVHDTYAGSKPGPLITFYAFKALMNGEHFVSYGMLLLFTVVYFCISLSLFSRRSLFNIVPVIKKSKSRVLHFQLSFFGYGTVLMFIAALLYVTWGVSVSILIPTIYFAIQKTIINFKRTAL